MKSVRTVIGLVALCGMLGLMTGCGDDDNGNGGAAGSGAPAATANAPATLSGNDYNITEPAGTSTVSFNGNTYTLSRPGIAQESGTFVATKIGNDTWDVTLLNSLDGSTSRLVLTFAANGTGTFSYTAPGATGPVSGQFVRSGFGSTPPGSNTSTNSPGTPTGPTPTTAPATLSQIVLNGRAGNPAGAGQIVVNINGSTFAYAGGSTSGTVFYVPSGTTARLRLNYAGSTDVDDYTLQFMAPSGSPTLSTYSGTQKVGVNEGPASGTFTYTQ
jgi:hypothetical protein